MATATVQSSALAARLAQDVDANFPELVAAYKDSLYSGVRAYVGASEAEDVTQEAFMRAHRALTSYEPARIETLALSAWIWTIALNLCRNWFRSKSRRPQTVQLSFDRAAPGSVEAEALDTAMLGSWRDRLARLSEPQRAAVVLRHVVGLSYREISVATDRPIGTTKTDVSRGLAVLARIIEEEATE